VLAAADGVVQSVLAGSLGTEWTIQVSHSVGGREAYRTIYGVATVAPGVTPGEAVTSGQSLGIVSSFTRTIGTTTVTYAFTHFQVDDFSVQDGLTNRNAVSPERFLAADAQRMFDTMWPNAVYTQELTEPFATNPRDVTSPITRTWRLASGSLAAQLDLTRASATAVGHTYVIRGPDGATLETGTVDVDPLARPVSALDFLPAGSALPRRGVYSIVGDAMQLDYGAPGAARPTSLAAASRYATNR
jgi:hypothetical protein